VAALELAPEFFKAAGRFESGCLFSFDLELPISVASRSGARPLGDEARFGTRDDACGTLTIGDWLDGEDDWGWLNFSRLRRLAVRSAFERG